MMMNFNSQFNTNKNATQVAYNRMLTFLGNPKGAMLMNGDYEPRFVKLLYDYAEFKESDKEFGTKFAKLSKAYVKDQKPTTFPEWFKKLVVAVKKVNDNDIEGIANRSAISSSDFRYLVFKVLQDFRTQEKHLNIIKRDYSRYINLDVEG